MAALLAHSQTLSGLRSRTLVKTLRYKTELTDVVNALNPQTSNNLSDYLSVHSSYICVNIHLYISIFQYLFIS